MIVKIFYGYLCLKELNICFDNNQFCKQKNVNYKKVIVVCCFQGLCPVTFIDNLKQTRTIQMSLSCYFQTIVLYLF